MSINRYDEYKEAEADSLGRLPKHWNYSLLKRWITVKSGDMISSDEETESGTPIIGGNGIRSYTNKSNTPGNTLVIGRVGAKCGCVHHIQEPFWASEHAFRVVEKKSINKRYLFHLLSSLDLNQFAIKTAQPLLNTEIVETQWIFNPPLSEQTQIARFLDRETAKIDALIAEQQRLIELLQVKRQAVISHAVTKGLNPNAPMKDSGVEWAPKLPEHWTAKHLKRNVRLLTEKTDTTECHVGLENLEGWTGRFIQTESDFQSEGVGFEADDILFGKLRPYLAKVWLADRNGEAIGDFHVLRPYERVNPRFIQYQLLTREVVDLVDGSSYGAKMPRASWGFLGCLEMPSPPAEEQLAIACFLDRETAKIDALIAEAPRAIKLLQERRSALISAAVTGQIDVRGLVEVGSSEQ